jgi:endonuclease-3
MAGRKRSKAKKQGKAKQHNSNHSASQDRAGKKAGLKKKAQAIIRILRREYGGAKIALHYKGPLQLLISIILSAQCTDKRVNMVTPALFRKYRNAMDFANAGINDLQECIRSTGFYRNKAANIKKACRMILDEFRGRVPDTMEGILRLPGVARKTANIVLGNAYGVVEGIAVDTHVMRLSQRLGLSPNSKPEKIERDLMEIIPKREWLNVTYLLIEHGRAVCKAPVPFCSKCPLSGLCPRKGVARHK